MLTELIEEYAKRYVKIEVSKRPDYEFGSGWKACVSATDHPFTPPTLPEFTFTAVGKSVEVLLENLRANLSVCEPIIAHRESYLKSRNALRNQTSRMEAAAKHFRDLNSGKFQQEAA